MENEKEKKVKPEKKSKKRDSDMNPFFSVLDEKTHSSIKEAYKTARTNIMFAISKTSGCKKIVFTSSIPGEGKTTSCINTATVFAQTGANILVIDADLRKPRVHKYANLGNGTGLSSILGGFCEMDDLEISKCEYGFDVMTSGPIPPNPAELLSLDKMVELLDFFNDKYDYIFIDSPPVNLVSDPMIISKLVDGVLIVVRQKYTSHDAVKKAISTLEFADAKIIGLFLNDARDINSGYKYRYRFRYGYRYGYKYGYKYGYQNHYGYHNS